MSEAGVPRGADYGGAHAVDPAADVLILGEMGIGNSTVAAALACAVFGGDGGRLDRARRRGRTRPVLARKVAAVDGGRRPAPRPAADADYSPRSAGASRRRSAARCWQARARRIPVILDGFICTAAVAPLHAVAAGSAARIASPGMSAPRPGTARCSQRMGLQPILDLGMRLGEGTGAAAGARHRAGGARLPRRHGDLRRGRGLGRMIAARLAEMQVAAMLLTRLPLGRARRAAAVDCRRRLGVPALRRAGRRGRAGRPAAPAACGLPAGISAALAVAAAIVWLTGALHEDGLADFADGLGGGRDRRRGSPSCATAGSAASARWR